MAGIGVVCLGLQCGQSMRWSQGQKQLRPARPSAIRPRKVHTKQVDFSLSGERELLKVTVDRSFLQLFPLPSPDPPGLDVISSDLTL